MSAQDPNPRPLGEPKMGEPKMGEPRLGEPELREPELREPELGRSTAGPSDLRPRDAEPRWTAPEPRPRVAVVALVAALIGALIGSGITVATLVTVGRQAEPVAARPVPLPVSAPDLPAPADDGQGRVAAIAAAVLPTVVRITAGGTGGSGAGEGSGVIYRSDGYIITNNHVVAGGGALEVVFADRSRAAGEVVGTDVLSDLAVIKVDRDGLSAIQIGDSGTLRVGELAVAVGSPFGLEGSVTAGIISGLNRPITVPAPDGGPVPLPNVIQTDAPINPGNSGGALVGGDGRLIGVNSAILSATGQPANAGVGFAIPVNTAVDIAEELIEQGFAQHPFLGVAGTSVDPETAQRVGVEAGAFVESVEPGTPAAEVGLQAEDIIVAVDGAPIRSMEDLVVAVRDREVGESLDITYRRGDLEQTVSVTLAERPR